MKSKPRKLTQRQAWLAIARYFRRKDAKCGICGAISRLAWWGRITGASADSLFKLARQVDVTRDKGLWDYWWPTNARGNAARVKFCRERAREAKR